MKQAMIFAAGLGTRLKPLTDTIPKALVTVGGMTLLERVVLKLRDAEFERIVVNVHHFSQQIIDFLAAHDNFGVDIRISDESDMLLETGGGVRKALPLFDPSSPILIHNVDILSNVDVNDVYHELCQSGRQTPDGVLLTSQRVTKRYLLTDDEHRLVGWTNVETGEVRSPHEHLDVQACRKQAFSGIHVLGPALFPLLRQWPSRFPIMDFYLRHCADVRLLCKEKADLKLVDVGKLNTLQQLETDGALSFLSPHGGSAQET